MKLQKKYFISIGALIVLLCLIFVMWSVLKPGETDKDELQDSDYITGTSDKFDDTAEDNGEAEQSDEPSANQNVITDGSGEDSNSSNVTTGNSNSAEDGQQSESKNDDNKEDNKEEVSKEDEGWTGFY